MTFIPAEVCSSYHGCEKTFVILKPRVNFIPRSGHTLLSYPTLSYRAAPIGGIAEIDVEAQRSKSSTHAVMHFIVIQSDTH